MNEQKRLPSPAPTLAAPINPMAQMQDQWAFMEARIKELEAVCIAQERDVAVLSQDKESWRERAKDAESRAHRYAIYAVELITRMQGLQELGEIMSRTISKLVEESKTVAFRPNNPSNGTPQPELVMSEEDDARLKSLAARLGAGRPEEEREGS